MHPTTATAKRIESVQVPANVEQSPQVRACIHTTSAPTHLGIKIFKNLEVSASAASRGCLERGLHLRFRGRGAFAGDKHAKDKCDNQDGDRDEHVRMAAGGRR